MICTKTILPNTKVLTFYRNVERKDLRKYLPFLRYYDSPPEFSKEDVRDEIDTFRNGCGGDSGSGQVFYKNAPEISLLPPRFVLAAIHVRSSANTFDFKHQSRNGKMKKGNYGVPCGSYLIKTSKNTKRPQVFKRKGVSLSTTYEKIFKWIKSRIMDRTSTVSETP